MRVLFNSWRDLDHPLAGGSEIVLDQLATGLHERGHTVAARCGGTGDLVARKYEVLRGGGDLTQYALTPLHHRRWGSDADVVVDVSNGMSFFTPAFQRSVPTVSLVHHVHTAQWDLYFPKPIAGIGRRLESDAMPRVYADGLCVTISASTRNDLVALGFRPDRLRVLPPAAVLDVVPTPERTEPLFVALGRLTTHKRLDLLLRLWPEVHRRVGGELLIVGDGPERARLERAAPAGVRFAGRVSEQDKADLLAEAWALVHSAAHEGWGLVISEAGLAATTSVGFDVAGVRDAIEHEVSGLLASSEDDFVAAWLRVAEDRDLRSKLAAGAQRRAAAFSVDNRVDAFESVLIEAVDVRRQRRRARNIGSWHNTVAVSTPSLHAARHAIDLSLIVPAYNEASRLPALLDALATVLPLASTEVIVVDDGSTDATSQVATQHLVQFPRGRLEQFVENRGKGAALRRGVETARGETVMFMDSDMATDLSDIERVLAALKHAHVAIGSRTHPDAEVRDPHLHRQLMGAGFNHLVRTLTNVTVRDSQCGFKAFRGDVARLLFHLSTDDGFGQDVELLEYAMRLGLDVVEVPVRWHAVEGSKVRVVRDSLRTAATVGRLAFGPTTRALVPVASFSSGLMAPETLAKSLAATVRTTDAVFVDHGAVHVLLAGVSPDDVTLVGDRIEREVGVLVDHWTLDARSLLTSR